VQGNDVNIHLPSLAAATVFMNTTWMNSGEYTYLIQPTNKSCWNALIAL
jgi:anti-sigma factor ChrR (cupin superfamily)